MSFQLTTEDNKNSDIRMALQLSIHIKMVRINKTDKLVFSVSVIPSLGKESVIDNVEYVANTKWK